MRETVVLDVRAKGGMKVLQQRGVVNRNCLAALPSLFWYLCVCMFVYVFVHVRVGWICS